MKKIFFVISALVMLTLASCKNIIKSDNDSDNDNSFNHSEWVDSIIFLDDIGISVNFQCDYPIGESVTTDSINKWICEQFGDSTHEYIKDIDRLVYESGSLQLKRDSNDIAPYVADHEPDDYPIYYEKDITINKEYEDSEYITMQMQKYRYKGGAHGSTIVFYATFRKSDGKRMDWELLSDMTNGEIIEKIKKGLCEYLEVNSYDELREKLILPYRDDEIEDIFNNHFPLPATPPFLTDKGVCIIYQQYEIACYADGLPTCVIKKRQDI